jgi:hypothetical protein
MSNSWQETCASPAMRAQKLLANGSFQFIYSTGMILFGEKAMRNAANNSFHTITPSDTTKVWTTS